MIGLRDEVVQCSLRASGSFSLCVKHGLSHKYSVVSSTLKYHNRHVLMYYNVWPEM